MLWGFAAELESLWTTLPWLSFNVGTAVEESEKKNVVTPDAVVCNGVTLMLIPVITYSDHRSPILVEKFNTELACIEAVLLISPVVAVVVSMVDAQGSVIFSTRWPK